MKNSGSRPKGPVVLDSKKFETVTLSDNVKLSDIRVGYRVRYRIDSHIVTGAYPYRPLCDYPLPAYFAYFPHKATCVSCLAEYRKHLLFAQRLHFDLQVLHARWQRWRRR